jgi:hypothetical protein
MFNPWVLLPVSWLVELQKMRGNLVMDEQVLFFFLSSFPHVSFLFLYITGPVSR